VWWVVSRLVGVLEPIHLHERAIFYYAMGAMLLGAQFVTAGFLAEMITATHMRDATVYTIKQRTGSRAGRQTGGDGEGGAQLPT
jgi:dolichol-phosphate mannosyltransferase